MVSPSNEPIRVNVIQDSLLGETRVNIGLPNGGSVTHVRAHNFITAFFLSLFGKIEKVEGRDIKTQQMKTFYINRNSLINKSPDKNQLNTSESGNNLVKLLLSQVKAENTKSEGAAYMYLRINKELITTVLQKLGSDHEKNKEMISALTAWNETGSLENAKKVMDSGALDHIKKERERKNAFKFLMKCDSNDAENLFRAALDYVNQLKAPDKYDNGYDNPTYDADLIVHERKIGFLRDGVLTKFVNQVRSGYVDEKFIDPLVNDDNFMSFLIEKGFIQKE